MHLTLKHPDVWSPKPIGLNPIGITWKVVKSQFLKSFSVIQDWVMAVNNRIEWMISSSSFIISEPRLVPGSLGRLGPAHLGTAEEPRRVSRGSQELLHPEIGRERSGPTRQVWTIPKAWPTKFSSLGSCYSSSSVSTPGKNCRSIAFWLSGSSLCPNGIWTRDFLIVCWITKSILLVVALKDSSSLFSGNAF